MNHTTLYNKANHLLQVPLSRDCQDVALTRDTNASGSYTITLPDDVGSFHVFCDMESNGGGWTVFQKRFNGSVNFSHNWQVYENGFGSSDGKYG